MSACPILFMFISPPAGKRRFSHVQGVLSPLVHFNFSQCAGIDKRLLLHYPYPLSRHSRFFFSTTTSPTFSSLDCLALSHIPLPLPPPPVSSFLSVYLSPSNLLLSDFIYPQRTALFLPSRHKSCATFETILRHPNFHSPPRSSLAPQNLFFSLIAPVNILNR